jgi:alpha-glucosidase
MESFLDGMNAHRRADDYAFKAGQSVKAGSAMKIHMAPGGGFALKFTK